MKKYLLFFLMTYSSINALAQTAFTPGTLSIYRAGDGVTALVNTGNQVFIDEYTTTNPAVLVRSIALPTAPAGANGSLITAGTSTSEGLLTRSADGTVLLATGYNATPPYASSLSATTSATVNRSIGVIRANGSVDITTKLTDLSSASSPRSAVSNNNGGNLWGGGGAGGVRYTTLGATTSTQINTTSPPAIITNIRQVNIFNGNLYFSTGSATIGIYQVGTGLPSVAGQVNTLIVAIGGTTPNPYSFAFNPAGDVLYVANDVASAVGGIQKYTFSGGVWTLQYTLATGVNIGAKGLAVDFTTTPSTPILYATTSEATANRLYKITDAGASSVGATIATAPAATAFRGVAFSPQVSVVPVHFISFTSSSRSNSIGLNWVTANENDISAYTIQKSKDGRTFEDISNVAARNNGIGGDYNFNYSGKSNAALYFRIKATELSGRIFYSGIIKAESKSVGNLNVYPTATSGNITVQYNKENEQGNLVIINMAGKEVFRKDVSANISAETINVQVLQAGAYIIKYSTKSGTVETGRFVKQ